MDPLKDIFNSVFDDCIADGNSKVECSLLIEKLTSMHSGDEEQSTIKRELSNLLRNRRGSRISRQDFLKCMMASKTETEPITMQLVVSPTIPGTETYEYHGRRSSSSETSELEQDLERSFSSLPSSLDSTQPREREINLYLIRMGLMKDKKINRLEKENGDLKREIASSAQNEEALTSSYKKKIEDLKKQLRDSNENYLICCKKADMLDEVEHELYECSKQKKRLENQLNSLQADYKAAMDQISLLDEKNKAVLMENEMLRNKLEDQDTLYLKMEQLRVEKQELQEKLVNVSVSMCPNMVNVSDDDISPDRMLISFPTRERGMSLDQELSLLPQPFSKNSSASSSRSIFAHSVDGFFGGLSTEEKSTSCSDLVPAVVELATQTEAYPDGLSRRKIQIINIGTQTVEGHSNDDDNAGVLPEKTCTRCQLPTVNMSVATPTGFALTMPFIRSRHSQLQETSMANVRNISRGSESTSSVSSTTSFDSYILSTLVYIVILFACALVFFTFVINSDLVVGRITNWVADLSRNSIQYRYRRGLPPH